MSIRTVFLTIAGPDIGLGHLTRCDALATAVAEDGDEAELIIACPIGSEWLSQRAPTTRWRHVPWNTDLAALRTVVDSPDEAIDVVLVDSYEISPEVRSYIDTVIEYPVYFDDTGGNVPERGIVVNGSPGADRVGYPVRSGLTVLTGPRYQVVRQAFWDLPKRESTATVRTVGIMLGGTDHRSRIAEVVSSVREIVPERISLVVIGHTDPEHTIQGVKYTGRLSAAGIRDTLRKIDVLISAAGQTVAEAVACGTPTVTVQTAENQRYNVEGWARTGCTVHAGTIGDPDLPGRLGIALQEVNDRYDRITLSHRNAGPLISGAARTLSRIVREVRIQRFGELTVAPFPLLNRDSLEEVLSWRNDPSIRQWMDTRAQIPLDDHIAFAAVLADDETRQFFRVDHGDRGIGVVDLTNIDRTRGDGELGLYRCPTLAQYRVDGRSVGRVLMSTVERLARRIGLTRLWLKVRTENERAIRLYRAVGYREYDTDDTYLYYEKGLG
ncbi:MAG: UDP-4-amino-4,6-dideoxy-N-acetyl-beta-L-altrosamine N-acetyltransferase [Spirochaeta sp.]|jgi:UDP-2,4-diacetamido-2,4,6-trideoxy-beta-L-altropyranose hydrolase|nr:UDP-4-amino-4,6-dideoxy-N-acetyl-beta-L-altrosamine N-acetyltransferase [Spirochaeta sp.]